MIIDCEKCGEKMPQRPFAFTTVCKCGKENWHPIYRGPEAKIKPPSPPPFRISRE